ncbi:hypothetical protein L3X38_016971 [Prunus dulcis]|uniref:Ubiquitin-like protease family profile domain-containing protein n=1 Tax=Prunus dulcis TaxID=3755 RepID=A0AAD4W6A3_PRUDU|nr:hypothetical protein L3X38_016971 [Prunus dulcis]
MMKNYHNSSLSLPRRYAITAVQAAAFFYFLHCRNRNCNAVSVSCNAVCYLLYRNRNCNAVSSSCNAVCYLLCRNGNCIAVSVLSNEVSNYFPFNLQLTKEASQPDATNPIPDPPKGTSLHDSIPVGLEQSSDEDEGQKKPTKKKLGWGQRKVWQKIPKADRERIEKHYLSTQSRDIFWAGLNSEKVTNHDLKDIVWDLELSQNVIEAYIQIEEDKIEPMQTESPQYMSTWTWAYMQSFQEPFWHRALYEHLLEKLGKCSVLFFPIISKEEFHFTLLTFHKNERKWRHYNPLRSLGHRKEERCIDIARNFVNIVEGWLEYIRPQARVFIETKKKPTLVKQKEVPPTLVQKDLTPTEELTLNWIMQNPLHFPFEDDMECAQQTVSS